MDDTERGTVDAWRKNELDMNEVYKVAITKRDEDIVKLQNEFFHMQTKFKTIQVDHDRDKKASESEINQIISDTKKELEQSLAEKEGVYRNEIQQQQELHNAAIKNLELELFEKKKITKELKKKVHNYKHCCRDYQLNETKNVEVRVCWMFLLVQINFFSSN